MGSETYAYGDWVADICVETAPEVGRVARDNGDFALVCFNCGCTAARMPKRLLRRATMEEILSAPRGVGFHRFDKECPEYDAECCGGCVHAKKEKKWKTSSSSPARSAGASRAHG